MNGKRIVAIGAHPDDIEFGCGAFLLDAVDKGALVTLVALSKGEAGTQGDGSTREVEAQYAATLLGATLHFVDAGGDTGIRANLDTTLTLAKEIRRLKPDILLAPTGHLNQHPDHREANVLVRDAHRLARYGKTPGLEDQAPHTAQLLLFYEISSGGNEGDGLNSILVDVSSHVDRWKELMQCHASQVKNMDYIDLQLSRARVYGIQVGVHSAQRLFSESPLLAGSSEDLSNFKSQRF
ncbi:MAG: PIG-L family deacetylase [Opitutales bacterium]|nr:PIG-L family deacetylase [Opitutales bacterium]